MQTSVLEGPVDLPPEVPAWGSEATHTDPVGEPPSNGTQSDFTVTSLSRLFEKLGVRSISQWELDANGQMQMVSSSSELAPAVSTKIALLANNVLALDNAQALLLPLQSPIYVVAAPIPGVEGSVLTANFEITHSHTPEEVEGKCRDVSLAAAHLALLKLRTAPGSPAPGSPAPGSPAPMQRAPVQPAPVSPNELDATTDPNAPELNWKQVRGFLKSQTAGFLNDILGSGWKILGWLVVLVLVGIIPWPHNVKCTVTCEPAMRRIVAAPFESKLLKAHVTDGDRVSKGDLLAVLDGGELVSRRAGLEAKLAQARQRRAAAMTTRDASKSEMERLEISQLENEIDVLSSRQARLEILSPIDGIVVSGDLERATGATLTVGENLFEIAPLNKLIVEIEIPEKDISHVKDGMQTSIQLDAARGKTHNSEVARIHPRNELRDNQSVFIADAEIQNIGLMLRPGMIGQAKIHAGWQPLGWIVFHRPAEELRKLIGW